MEDIQKQIDKCISPGEVIATTPNEFTSSRSISPNTTTMANQQQQQQQQQQQEQVEATGSSSGSSTTNHKEIILKKLEEIPLDKLKEIITNQIDLEIQLKHKELQLTEIITNQIDLEIQLKHKELQLTNKEINKIESQLLILRKFFDIPTDVKLTNEPNDFTIKYFDILNKSLSSTYENIMKLQQQQQQLQPLQEHQSQGIPIEHSQYPVNPAGISPPTPAGSSSGHIYRTRSTTSSLRPSSTSHITTSQSSYPQQQHPQPSAYPPYNQRALGCLYRRTDGVVVRLKCPDCQRSNFSSAQGFLNHSRIAHAKEYTSQDAAALKCGEILPEIKQDIQGEESLRRLNEKGIDPNRNLNICEISFGGTGGAASTIPSTNANTKTHGIHQQGSASRMPTKQEILLMRTKSPKPHILTSLHHHKLTSESELFKKLMKEGKMKREEYEQLIKDTEEQIEHPQFLDDELNDQEDDGESEASSGLSANPSSTSLPSLHKRRQSRGGINIANIANGGNENREENANDDEVESEEEAKSTSEELVDDNTPDIKRRKKS
ncbi:uncharacterized protein J8A68_002636 [[Candida] subhashii]|uniref:AHC1-like C2H2 zinc-finger domain-containing protein n=1 Tax=[Candida] subhashii TaxID=561895 RepID=A0A8J5QNF8_9ASCO|nr:uncharacterized protein J8A68_002636 [[Candida] subhashii]KAG7663776.1 hypothetical protein J8A68_002636 [[Candida] subhashii]